LLTWDEDASTKPSIGASTTEWGHPRPNADFAASRFSLRICGVIGLEQLVILISAKEQPMQFAKSYGASDIPTKKP